MEGKFCFFSAIALSLVLSAQAFGKCTPKAPEECFSDDPIKACKTCCCKSDDRVTFYDKYVPEPCCKAKSVASYTVRFVGTWSPECHPDYYTEEAKWSEFVAASHKGGVRLWDHCFDKVTPGMQRLAEQGKGNLLEEELDDLISNGKAYDQVKGPPISDGTGRSIVKKPRLQVHPDFPYVSTAVMQGGSPDFIVGVSQMSLCNEDKWPKKIQMCGELFSTNTSHIILGGESHSVQGGNCSFGYFEFQLNRVKEMDPSPDSCSCQPKKEPFCPSEVEPAQVKACPTCCCQNSKNAVFYDASKGRSTCNARRAVYNVTYYATWSRVCHPDYYFNDSQWSPFSAVSHDHRYQMWNPCMYNVTKGVGVLSNTGATDVIEMEYMNAGRRVLNFTKGDLLSGSGVSSSELRVDDRHQYISVATMLVPSLDRMMGVAGLDMCDGRQWKKHVRVCGELFSTGYKTDITKRPNTLQDKNCSFGYFDFRLMPPPEPILDRDRCPPPPNRCPPPPPPRPPPPESCPCQPKLPKCRRNPIESCSTCCCNSSQNVEFYDSCRKQKCDAKPATYKVTFIGTWTQGCHPDYYFNSAHWSPLTGASHDPSYEVWNACMYNVSRGVALVSQTGSTSTIEREYKAQGDKVLDTGKGSVIDGDGRASFMLNVDANHSFVSVLTMLAPSVDRMMGVSRLRLCDDNCWRERVVVCGELFSTATKSERVGTPNTIQFQNCSFGYFLFERVSCEGGMCDVCPTPKPVLDRDKCPAPDGRTPPPGGRTPPPGGRTPPPGGRTPPPGGRTPPPGGRTPPPEDSMRQPSPDSCQCQPKLPKCRSNPIQSCSTCCCNSSRNVEFYDQHRKQKCVASRATYQVTFIGTWTQGCHPDYYFNSAHWSPLTGASHDPSYEVWNACMYNVSRGVALVSQTGSTSTIEREYKAQGDKVLDTGRGSVIDGDGRASFMLNVDANHSFVSVLTMLAPSVDRMMGVSRLRLCNDNCWRERVVVCGELFSTATKSERVGTPNTIQFQNCSFGYFLFERKSCDGGKCGNCSMPKPCPKPILDRNKCPAPTREMCPPPPDSRTPPPDRDSTRPPDRSSTEPPDGSSTEPPDGSSTEPPDGSSTEPPDGSSTEPPDGSGTDGSGTDGSGTDGSGTEPPGGSSTEPPDGSSTEPPDEDGTPRPDRNGTARPDRGGTQPPPSDMQPSPNSCQCQPKLPNCRDNPIQSCPTCCCSSSNNVEFYDQRRMQKCVANPATYRVTFMGTWTQGCHPDYYFNTAHWSPLTGASHDPSYEVWNACMYNVSQGVALVSQTGSTSTIEREYMAQGDKVLDTGKGSVIDGDGRASFMLNVDANHSFVSVLTMLAPSVDRMMGVSRLRLCDDNCWRERVMVCGELFSTATKSERVDTPNTIQFQNCSFGYFLFERVSCEGGMCGPCPAPVPPMPTALTGLKKTKTFRSRICPLDFVMRATVLHIYRDYMPPDCKMRLMVKVVRVYKGTGIAADDIKTICMVKSPIAIELGMDYLFAGDQDKTGCVIKANGYIEAWNNGRRNKSSTKAKRC